MMKRGIMGVLVALVLMGCAGKSTINPTLGTGYDLPDPTAITDALTAVQERGRREADRAANAAQRLEREIAARGEQIGRMQTHLETQADQRRQKAQNAVNGSAQSVLTELQSVRRGVVAGIRAEGARVASDVDNRLKKRQEEISRQFQRHAQDIGRLASAAKTVQEIMAAREDQALWERVFAGVAFVFAAALGWVGKSLRGRAVG